MDLFDWLTPRYPQYVDQFRVNGILTFRELLSKTTDDLHALGCSYLAAKSILTGAKQQQQQQQQQQQKLIAVQNIDIYEVFGISSSASASEIKDKYKFLMMEHHPDKNQNSDGTHAQLINECYDVLKDPELRKLYDDLHLVNTPTNFQPYYEEKNKYTEANNLQKEKLEQQLRQTDVNMKQKMLEDLNQINNEKLLLTKQKHEIEVQNNQIYVKNNEIQKQMELIRQHRWELQQEHERNVSEQRRLEDSKQVQNNQIQKQMELIQQHRWEQQQEHERNVKEQRRLEDLKQSFQLWKTSEEKKLSNDLHQFHQTKKAEEEKNVEKQNRRKEKKNRRKEKKNKE